MCATTGVGFERPVGETKAVPVALLLWGGTGELPKTPERSTSEADSAGAPAPEVELAPPCCCWSAKAPSSPKVVAESN